MNEGIHSQSRKVMNSIGEQLAFRFTQGAGPVVVFFPGYASDMNGTKALYLESWCRYHGRAFLRFDYSGHGESEGEFTRGTIGQWTNDALTIINESTTGPLVLVGSSMGGWIMLLAALALGERVTGLVGIAPAPDFTKDLMWRSLSERDRQTLLEQGEVYPASDYVDDPFPITLKLIEEAEQQLVLNAPINIECPVRLIHGLDDPDVPWETSLKLAEKLSSRNVDVRLLKGGGHRLSDPQHLELIATTIQLLP